MIQDEQIKSLPQAIGVYLFKHGEEYVYIGKSLNIRERVHNHEERTDIDAKEKAIRSVDHERVLMYWRIGKVILEEEQGGKTGLDTASFY